LKQPTTLTVPEFITAPRANITGRGVTLWSDVLAAVCRRAR
jgi:hypothetical protein